MNKHTDKESRELIVTSLDKNYFVVAGAGSGKTTMLVERMVALVESGVDISTICSITFTKKAANEFYQRFHDRLIERSSLDYELKDHEFLGKVTKESAIRCKEAALNIDLCFLGTIDSFCNKILSEYPINAKVPVTSTILEDETEKTNEYKNIFLEIINGTMGSDLKKSASYFSKFYRNPESVFLTHIDKFTSRRNYDFIYPHLDSVEFNNMLKEEKRCESLVKRILKFIFLNEDKLALKEKEPYTLLKNKYRLLEADWTLDNYTTIIKALKKLYLVLDENDEYKKDVNKALSLSVDLYNDLDADLKEYFYEDTHRVTGVGTIPIYQFVLPVNDNPVKYMKDIIYSYTMDFFDRAKDMVAQELRRRGKLTFFDNLLYLRDMLEDDAATGGKLIKHLQGKYKYFLIDESQDTNPLQSEVFFYLSSKDPKEVWYRNEPMKGSLFIVGDPKQSIYRFQSADITSYFSVGDLFNDEDSEQLFLNNNFRSNKVLKKYFNNIFESMFAKKDGIQTEYDRIDNEDTQDYDGFKGIYSVNTKIARSKDYIIDTAKIVNNLVNNDKYQIYDRKDKRLRKIDYKDIMIVPLAKKKLPLIAEELYKYGIPAFVEGSVDFKMSDAFRTMNYLYSYIVTNGKKYLIGLFESKLFSYKAKKLMKLIETEYDFERIENNLGLDKNVDEIINFIIGLRERINEIYPSTIFELILKDLKIFKHISDDNLEQVYNAIELIRDGEISHKLITHEDTIAFISNMLETSEIERISPLTSNTNYVSLANLHKVKGLEAPIVILTGDKPKRDPGSSFISKNENDIETKKAYIFSAAGGPFGNTPDFETSMYQDEKDTEQEYSDAEYVRLLYVAATRAKDALIVMYESKEVNKTSHEVKAFTYYSPLTPLEMKVKDSIIEDGSFLREDREKTEQVIVDVNELYGNEVIKFDESFNKETYKYKLPSDVDHYIESILDEKVETEDIEEGEASSTDIGSQVHSLLEKMVSSKFTVDPVKLIRTIAKDNDDEMVIRLNKIYETMMNGGYSQPKDCFGIKDLYSYLKDKKCYTEVPFSYKEDDSIIYGIIDLIFEDENGIHIIDYKTNKKKVGLSLKYESQLELYKKAVEEITGEKVIDAFIYHIDI